MKQARTSKEVVLDYYPNAKCIKNKNEGYYIYDGETYIFDEYLLPDANSEMLAWDQAVTVIQTTQNFNRTHPLRMELEQEERKKIRRNKRINKPKKYLFYDED